MVAKVVLRVHTLTQDGETGYLEITIPRLKVEGAINLNLTSDGVSTFGLAGMAQEVSDECGSSYYADAKFYSDTTTDVAITGLAAVPNSYTLSLAGVKTATANILGLRNEPYSNVPIANSAITFQSAAGQTATVVNGLITGVAKGNTTITATYQGLTEIISVTVTD